MTEQLVPVRRTAATTADYVRAVMRSWHLVGDGAPLEQSIAVLYAQHIVETGEKNCWNWNFGNAKHVKGDGFDYQMLNGVWEGVSPAAAARLIASGEAVEDPSESHAKSVGAPVRQSVLYQPPHPATWFRAFATADEGMAEHLQLLARRFSKAWPAVLAGDFAGFAKLLHAQGYFTADPGVYASLMKRPFETLVASSTYEELVGAMHFDDGGRFRLADERVEATADDVAPHEAVRWDWEEFAGSGGIVHAVPEWPSYRDE